MSEKWPEFHLLKEISETLKTILKEDREWRAEMKSEKEMAIKMAEDTRKRLESQLLKFRESISPFSDLNETMKPFFELARREEEERKEFSRRLKEGLSQN